MHVSDSLLRYLLSGKGVYGACDVERVKAGINAPEEATYIEQGFR